MKVPPSLMTLIIKERPELFEARHSLNYEKSHISARDEGTGKMLTCAKFGALVTRWGRRRFYGFLHFLVLCVCAAHSGGEETRVYS